MSVYWLCIWVNVISGSWCTIGEYFFKARQQKKKWKLLEKGYGKMDKYEHEYYTLCKLSVFEAYRVVWSCVSSPLTRAPRFCVTHSYAIKQASAELKLWHLRQEKPRKDVDPFPQIPTLLPLRPKSCTPQISDIQVGGTSILTSLY